MVKQKNSWQKAKKGDGKIKQKKWIWGMAKKEKNRGKYRKIPIESDNIVDNF